MEILPGFLSANDASGGFGFILYLHYFFWDYNAYKAELKFSKILELRGNF